MTFRESLARDLELVMINPKEMASQRGIEGQSVWLVEEADAQGAKRPWSANQDTWMLDSHDLTIHLAEGERVRAELAPFYAGQRLLYEGEPLQVLRSALVEGLWTVTLSGPSLYAGEVGL